MANRRMFSLDVIDTDSFLGMGPTAQNLYFHLGMRADDDGFVSSPKKIAKIVNSGEDDFRLLVVKGYVQPFDSGVIVIRHWGQNNYIQKDRYKPTRYIKEREMLIIDNGVYYLDTERIQDVSKMETQVRLGKDSIDKDSIDKDNKEPLCSPEDERDSPNSVKLQQEKDDFEKIYAIYPKKRGKRKAFEYYRKWLRGRSIDGETIRLTNRKMYIAVRDYVREKEEDGTEDGAGLQFFKNFDTFMNKAVLDYIPEE